MTCDMAKALCATARNTGILSTEAFNKAGDVYQGMAITDAAKADLSLHQPSGPIDPWKHSAILLEFSEVVLGLFDRRCVAWRFSTFSLLCPSQAIGLLCMWSARARFQGVAYMVLNRPDDRNIIDEAFSAAFADAVYRIRCTTHTLPRLAFAARS
eukprot:6309848-Amphidinium_carterae.1